MTFDPSILTGQKVSGGVLIDELHVVAKMSGAASAIRQLRGGMLPFPESFLAFITTQSEEPPAGVFRAELMKARAIRDGRRQGAMLPVLYEFPEDIQRSQHWREPAYWPMVTPNAGRSITIGRLEEEYRDAKETGEEELRAWASQHLNIEIGLALKSDSWAGAEFWEAQGLQDGLTLTDLIKRSDVLTVGIDGGGLDDLLGLAVMGRDAKTGAWLAWTRAFAHPSVLERRKQEAQRFQDFAKDGDLVFVENVGQDVELVADIVEQCEASGLLDKVGVDQQGIGAIVDALIKGGIELERIVGISQGWKLTGAIKTAERKLAACELWHSNSRLMAWSVGNAKVEPRGNAIVITKQAAGFAKIDPLMALFDAVSLMMLNPQPKKKPVLFFA
jgi:phage terminase large subunit-like protein